MTHEIYHFGSTSTHWVLWCRTHSATAMADFVEQWKKTSHSKQSALKRADRMIGEIVRHAEPGTKFTYTKEIEVREYVDPVGV